MLLNAMRNDKENFDFIRELQEDYVKSEGFKD